MSILSTTTQTVSTVLNTVNVSAVRAAQFVNTVGAGLDMLDAYVQEARTKQLIDNQFSMASYMEQARKKAQENLARSRADLEVRLNADQNLLKHYTSAQTEMDELQRKIEAKLNNP